jgi:uncharacterized protein
VSLYLDASAIIPTLVEEAGTGLVRNYFAETRVPRLISDLAAIEVASGLSRLVRMRQLSAEDAHTRLLDFEGWRVETSAAVEVHPADARLAYVYVRRFDLKLRAPDALHLAIAHRAGATLVTFDLRLATAARELHVAVAIPGAYGAAPR